MNRAYLEKIFSGDRMLKYFSAHQGNEAKSMMHYQCNIEIAESFYPCLSVLEVALRNAVNRELITLFGAQDWYSHFPTTPGLGKLMKDITNAQNQITKRREIVTPPKVIAELTLGFWVRLFNAEFERILWKDLRRAFPYLPKIQRQRHTVSAPLNNFRNFRNRIFHNEPVCWSFTHLQQVHDQLIEAMNWINRDLAAWVQPFDRFSIVLASVKQRLV